MHQQSDIVYQKENKVVPKPEEFLQWWERKSEIQAFMEPLAFNHRTLRRGLLVNATVFLFFLTADWTLDDEVCVLSVRSNYTLLKMINCCCSWCCKNDKMFGTCLFNLHLLWIILKKNFQQDGKNLTLRLKLRHSSSFGSQYSNDSAKQEYEYHFLRRFSSFLSD